MAEGELLQVPLSTWTAFLSALTGFSLLTIAAIVMRHLRGGAWRQNPLATGVALLFLTAGVGHLLHVLHISYAWNGAGEKLATAVPVHFGAFGVVAAEAVAAIAAVGYLALRQRVPGIIKAGVMYADLEQRRDQALSVHDEVVQRLVRAQWYAQLGRPEEAAAVLDELLGHERAIMERLAGHARETRRLGEASQ